MTNSSLNDHNTTQQARALLLAMIRQKFHTIADYHLAILNQANEAQLLAWTVQLSNANDLTQVLGKVPNPRAENLLKLLQTKF